MVIDTALPIAALGVTVRVSVLRGAQRLELPVVLTAAPDEPA